MPTTTYLGKFVLGAGAIGAYYCLNTFNFESRKVYASWTTNYTPSPNAKWDDNWDHRSPVALSNPKKVDKNNNEFNQVLEKAVPKATRHLILIRHGQYNLDGKGDKQRYLTELGKNQAQLTGLRLKTLALPYTDLVQSTMTRAQETAEIICKSLPQIPIEECNLIREGAPVPPEPPIGYWKPEVHFYQEGARIEAGFRKYFHRADVKQEMDSYTILVCHANVIRYYVCRALQFPPEAWLRISLNHASITWLTITPSGRVILRCLGDSGHMPPEFITTQ